MEITQGLQNVETVVVKSSFIQQQITVILLHNYEKLKIQKYSISVGKKRGKALSMHLKLI